MTENDWASQLAKMIMFVNRIDLRRESKPTTYRKGLLLFEQKGVEIDQVEERSIRGRVLDGYTHNVKVRQDRFGSLYGECDCPAYIMPCEHVVALLLHVSERAEQGKHALAPPAWEDYLQNLNQIPPKPTAKEPKTWRLAFFIAARDSNWSIYARRTYFKKNGAPGQRAMIRLRQDGQADGVAASTAELQAIRFLTKQTANNQGYGYGYGYGYGSAYVTYTTVDDGNFQYGQEIGHVLDLLSASELYLDAGHALRVLRLQQELAFQFDAIQDEKSDTASYRIYPSLSLDGKAVAIDENCKILTTSPVWLLKEKTLYRVDSVLPAASLRPFTQKNFELKIPQEKLQSFLKGFLPHVKRNVQLRLPESVVLETLSTLTGRRLYLQEHQESLGIELRFLYGELEVEDSEGAAVSLASNPATQAMVRVERDLSAESASRDLLKTHGLQLDESHRFYVPAADPLSWLFDDLPQLALAGFEIYGEENLESHRVNRAAPRLNVGVTSGIDWFDMNVEIDFGGVMVSLSELRHAVKKNSTYVKLADGSLARIPKEWQKRFQHFFNFAEVNEDKAKVASLHAMLIDSLFDEIAEKRYDESFHQRLGKLRDFDGIKEVALPENFKGVLRPYQQDGLNWMGFLQEFGFNGCLADDMGLGKTVQALALLLREKGLLNAKLSKDQPLEGKLIGNGNDNGNGKSNGKAPRSRKSKAMVKNGLPKAALSEPSPSGSNALLSPSNGAHTSLIVAPLSVIFNWEKESARFAPDLKVLTHHGQDRSRTVEAFAQCDIVLTTYATMRLDIDLLKDFPFHYIILDESQNIKNPISQTAKAAGILRSSHRLVLTGTPVENNTLELWSQFSFLNPGMLGNLNAFRSTFTLPIERYGDSETADLLRKMISPFLLRRTKEAVVRELPPKSEQIFYCAMSPVQQKLYNRVRDQYRAEIMNLINSSGLNDARFKVLQGLTRLRQIACHPNLVQEGTREDSGKYEAFMDLLREIVAEGHKVLVFSQFVRMLRILAETLEKEEIVYEVLTGATRDRERRVTRFQEDKEVRVFLISLKAGGLGLNLTAADYVIVFDPWWNPAAERQAIDRAHRIGQDKNVFAYKMIARDTVEEKILELQKRKADLVSQLISEDTGLFKHLTADDIRELFS